MSGRSAAPVVAATRSIQPSSARHAEIPKDTAVRRFWAIFFIFWPILAFYVTWKAPDWNWWFPTTVNSKGTSDAPLGQRIDELFYLILFVTTVTFVGTQAALGYVLWVGSRAPEDDCDAEGNPRKAWFTHGSHNLEVMWTIVPAG